jgi:hypothetical protein
MRADVWVGVLLQAATERLGEIWMLGDGGTNRRLEIVAELRERVGWGVDMSRDVESHLDVTITRQPPERLGRGIRVARYGAPPHGVAVLGEIGQQLRGHRQVALGSATHLRLG